MWQEVMYLNSLCLIFRIKLLVVIVSDFDKKLLTISHF